MGFFVFFVNNLFIRKKYKSQSINQTHTTQFIIKETTSNNLDKPNNNLTKPSANLNVDVNDNVNVDVAVVVDDNTVNSSSYKKNETTTTTTDINKILP